MMSPGVAEGARWDFETFVLASHPPLSVLLGFSVSSLFAFHFFDVATWEPLSLEPLS